MESDEGNEEDDMDEVRPIQQAKTRNLLCHD
jgi:hypothetical protein